MSWPEARTLGEGGGWRVVLGTNLVQVIPLLVRALHKITKALRDLVHEFEIFFCTLLAPLKRKV